MLLLLLLIRTLSTSGHPLPANHLDSRASTDSCDDINNCRKLFDIVWGCLATIFACTWVSVHPNVPPPNQSRLALFGRRLGLMLIAVIAPELMVGFAARQFFAACWYAKEYEVSRTHGFFISMGGFVSRIGHHPVTTSAQLCHWNVSVATPTKYLLDIRAVKVEEIEDKSKGDALSKGVALVQILWFMTQCLARVGEKIAVTELEVTTLAFAVVNVSIWILWWNKPLDVQHPIQVGPREVTDTRTGEPLDNQPEVSIVSGGEKGRKGEANCKGRFGKGLVEALMDSYSWWRLVGTLTGSYSSWDYKPTSHTSVPSFWSTNDSDKEKFLYSLFIECLAGIIFGALHCMAWNAAFHSTAEMWMWRSCSALVAAIPSGFAMGLALIDLVDYGYDRIIVRIFAGFTIPLYTIARLLLITLPLIALRAPPPGALTDVNWSDYIPHL
ncbi:hypothetical protein DFH09DRAFT_1056463 [Mycena vulgaris]|nr:hypothetical protein DFH09DRAFT_1056463 [Mycena vulgaris]